MKVRDSLVSLFQFLQERERTSRRFSKEDLLSITKWKSSTLETYLKKGQLSDFISASTTGLYEASNCQNISEVEFAKLFSQSKHRRGLGHNCKSKLSKALLGKSKDNMLLALEMYNRPSLDNRMDAFVMCFCAAWEQLLKAILIEKDGEASIFKKNAKSGLKETISLRDCLERCFDEKSNIRKNVERIASIRDQAVHLLMPEIQGVASRMFQSGVLNYSSKFDEFTETAFLRSNYSGMMSLVGDFKTPPLSVLRSIYGRMAEDILELATNLEDEIEGNNDIEFAIPLNVRLGFSIDTAEGQTIALSKAEGGIDGLRKALVIEKPVDRSKTHPFSQGLAIKEINNRLHDKYDSKKLSKHLVVQDKKSGRHIVNQDCFQAVLHKNSWKNGNNSFHYKNENPEYHYYSTSLIEEFIRKIMEHEGYLRSAKASYSQHKRNKFRK